jgi:hypothetical protein
VRGRDARLHGVTPRDTIFAVGFSLTQASYRGVLGSISGQVTWDDSNVNEYTAYSREKVSILGGHKRYFVLFLIPVFIVQVTKLVQFT